MAKWLRWGALGFVGLIVLCVIDFKIYTYTQTEKMYEAVIRFVAMDGSMVASQPAQRVIFVQINGSDPSPEFLARFQGSAFSVRKGSQGQNIGQLYSENMTKDVSTGEQGIIIKFSKISWLVPTKPIVYAGGDGFVMIHDYGDWRVEYKTMLVT